ncbi:MAG TPA: hypothetical protein VGP07_24690 [Polyangia bacterium]
MTTLTVTPARAVPRGGKLIATLVIVGALGCGSKGGGAQTTDGHADTRSDAAGAGPVDCAAVCGQVGDLCAGRSDIDAAWLDVCRSQCQTRLQLQPDVASLEAACVGAATTCDTGVTCVATPTAPTTDAAARADRPASMFDAGRDTHDASAAVTDAPGFGPPIVSANVDGTPVVFDQVHSSREGDAVSIVAWTSDRTQEIVIETASGTGFSSEPPVTYQCTSSDISSITYTYFAGGPDAGPGQTYGGPPHQGSPCSVTYTRTDFTRLQGTFMTTALSASGSKAITGGVIDVDGAP